MPKLKKLDPMKIFGVQINATPRISFTSDSSELQEFGKLVIAMIRFCDERGWRLDSLSLRHPHDIQTFYDGLMADGKSPSR